MHALVYHGPGQRSWETVNDPEIIDATDAIVQVEASTICGTDLHLETLWIRDVTITAGLVDTYTIPRLMALIAQGRLDPTVFATHRFALADTMAAYDTFAAAADTGALKVVLGVAEPTTSPPRATAQASATA